MRAVIQRVKHSSVTVNNEIVGSINKGFNVLLGVEKGDTEDDMKYIADKILNLRIFEDDADKMNLSIQDVQGELLVISQFTLLADCRKGRRPSFIEAARPEEADQLYKQLVEYCKQVVPVETGIFQADMDVNICNDGPVTVMLDSKKRF